jgi:threonine dehydratase
VHLPGFADVQDAAAHLEGMAVRTPLIRHDALDALVGGKVFIKPECLQRTGTFKFRGAYNRICRLNADELSRGVVAFSSGNHAQGVAAAAAIMNTTAVIVMPKDAPMAKIEGTKALGGEVVLYDRYTQSREQIAAEIGAKRGSVVVPAYDDFHVIAGQGTVGLEAARQLEALGEGADVLLSPAGGGGLIGGIGLAFKALSPKTQIWGVEPEAYNDTALSLAAGHPVEVKPAVGTLCDALMAPKPGNLTFALNKEQLAGALGVSDAEALAAMAFAFKHLKIVLEPGGAVALAAVLAGKLDVRGKTALVVCSGGNVDAATYAKALER